MLSRMIEENMPAIHTPETPWTRSIPNTSGELERELRTRRFNVLEAFLVMTVLLVVLWYVQYLFGVLGDNEAINKGTAVFLTVAALYCLFGSPFLHKDTLNSWGLGNPKALWRTIRHDKGPRSYMTGVVVLVLTAGLAGVVYWQWIEVADFLFGMKEHTAVSIIATPVGKVGVTLLGLALAAFFSTCVIRYDNFLSALFTAVKVLLVLGAALYLLAFAVMGMSAFSDFEGPKFALDVFGYIFWGALQQLLFCSYFGTRLRKGFAPAQSPKNVWKVRLAVAVLNGAFFGIIHINSWSLVLVCWLLGCVLSWLFMEDRNRNLVALGFIHGFLGSSVGWLFDGDKAGGFEIEMGVGPTHMDGFDPLTMIVVTLLIIGFSVFIVRAWWRWREV
ncbi:MAG: hypothetical protein BWX80_00507 [Candidatus Hydrogenedentes bacterium ADurb.Bin101]|jgi:hypothetical protein|nr:MAG: hypothetical protein BWX80_00507 [Candidatus Hydrogenedentes bacterium ADurb.Bin101]